ncbi:MAG: hypothetical protein M3O09_01020 [Acidobacteriota bacterium]|nr:hypothetical protein [Acidobacteriota bacterium]
MAKEKELATDLLNVLEDMYLENLALTGVLMVFQQYAPNPWQRLVAEVKTAPETVEKARHLFAPLRKRIQEGDPLEEAIVRFLKVGPPSSTLH